MYCLRVFIVVLALYQHCLLQHLQLLHVHWKVCVTSFIVIGYCVRGLRLFIVVLQELHCIPNCLHVCMIKLEVAST